MGLLTDAKQRQRLTGIVVKHGNKICVLSYIGGLVWFLALPHLPLNASTYFSENALLPGLVDSEFYGVREIENYYNELRAELKGLQKLKDDQDEKYLVPAQWFETKFRELGLDTYVQNFTFTYPGNILRGQEFPGKNIYGILRAPRAASTEALVLSAPYRPPGGEFSVNNGAMALMLGLARFFRKKSYWAKDIIFLVTEHEQIGMQAWLSAYHQEQINYIKPGDLHGRSGSIQAAINLEIPQKYLSQFNLKIHGINGQLPNLDLVNTVVRLCRKDGVLPTLSKRFDHHNPESSKGYEHSLKTMLTMMWHQAPCSTTGNHGLFHKYRIEALTLEAVKIKGGRRETSFNQMARIVEGLFRSLNNLLERFHQSFFFYLLPATHRYISIGIYMPPFGLLAGGLIIKALALWIMSGPKEEENKSQEVKEKVKGRGDGTNDEEDSSDEENEDSKGSHRDLVSLMPTAIMAVFFGLACYNGPEYFIRMSRSFQIQPSESLMWGIIALTVSGCMFPRVLRRKNQESGDLGADWMIQKCVALLALGLMLGAVAILNISLAFFLAVPMTPVALIVRPTNRSLGNLCQYILLVAISPLMLLIEAGILHLYLTSEKTLSFPELVSEGWAQGQHTLLLAVVEGAMFGNWIFSFASLVLFPTWLLLWSLLWAQPK